MIEIKDDIHCEFGPRFDNFEPAIAELKRRSQVPWDQPPNRAPCTSWKKCGREYSVSEYDVSHTPWKLIRRVPVLKISADRVEWVVGFEDAWRAGSGLEDNVRS